MDRWASARKRAGAVIGQSAPPPPPAGWYPAEPRTERWWDGTRWTAHTRPTLAHDRIRWAGIPWGGPGGPRTQLVIAGVYVALALLPTLVAVQARSSSARAMGLLLASALVIAAVFMLVNAHFCRLIAQRRQWTPDPSGPPTEVQAP